MFVLKEVQLLGVEESPRQRFSQKNTFFFVYLRSLNPILDCF